MGSPGDSNQARMWNMWCHLSALAGFVIPFGNVLGPLLVWQIKKNEFPSVVEHGKAALNFQLTVLIVLLVGIVAAVLLSFVCVGFLLFPVIAIIGLAIASPIMCACFLLFPVIAIIGLAGLVFAVIAGIKANNGEAYRYPWSLTLIK